MEPKICLTLLRYSWDAPTGLRHHNGGRCPGVPNMRHAINNHHVVSSAQQPLINFARHKTNNARRKSAFRQTAGSFAVDGADFQTDNVLSRWKICGGNSYVYINKWAIMSAALWQQQTEALSALPSSLCERNHRSPTCSTTKRSILPIFLLLQTVEPRLKLPVLRPQNAHTTQLQFVRTKT